MNSLFDCMIVGAGPAGIATSLELSAAGWNVLLIDKAAFPREKVCGGFIGPENKSLLQRYGVFDDLMAQGAHKVTHVFLSASSGECVCVPIGKSGCDDFAIGFSRKTFDALLLKRTQKQGVVVKDMTLVKDFIDAGRYKFLTLRDLRTGEDYPVSVRHYVFSGGAMPSSAAQKSGNRLFGVAALFDRCEGIGNDVIMNFIPQGHAGINRFEGDVINVCYVIKEELFKRHNGNYEAIWETFLKANPWMRHHMGKARRLSSWKATFLDLKTPTRFSNSRGFLAGDAAGVIHPLAGGGISMALNAGVMLGTLMARSSPEQMDRDKVAAAYRHLWRRSFLKQTVVSKWIGALSHDARCANILIKLLKSQQMLVPLLFDLFHTPKTLTLKESL